MDTDEKELTPQMVENYKSGEMFKKYWFYDYIVPIYNDDNLDNVTKKLGYDIDIKNKARSYTKIFPGENGDIASFEEMMEKYKTSNCSNIYKMLEYFYKHVK